MENLNQTSFIPKQSFTPSVSNTPKRVSGLSLLAWFLFFVSILSVLVTFLWNKTLESKIRSMKSDISQIKLEEDTINDIKKLDKRIISSEEILRSHLVTSPIFRILEQRTLKTISFTKFSYSVSDPTGKNKLINVSMSGRAKSYDAIAQQSDELSKNQYIINPVFSNMVLDELRGVVSFDLSFSVNPSVISFENSFNSQSQGFNFVN